MADVRLTATNPEDSSVVPVACDAAGRLLLEEPQVIEGPAGPPGAQGPPGQNGQDGQDGSPGQDGDPFSGNFAGDVTFGGSAEFAGVATAKGLTLNPNSSSGGIYIKDKDNVGTFPVTILEDGSASFAGDVTVGDPNTSIGGSSSRTDGVFIRPEDTFTDTATCFGVYDGGFSAPNRTISFTKTGSAEFAGKKAGFTDEGYLWCTTRRGDTVILDFTSNGAGQWVEYTPTTRIEEIRDNLDANRGDTGEMPADTP